jgi:hypothetical protein
LVFIRGQMLRRDVMLAFAWRTVNNRNFICFCPGSQATAESPGHAHQMIVVEVLVRAIQRAPPHAKAAAGLTH